MTGGAGQPPSGSGQTFEDLMAELEDVTSKLAAGDLGIEAATDLYERAERLHAMATERLDQVRARVEGLTGDARRTAAGTTGSGEAPEG